MVECEVAGIEWTNQEGFIRITNTPTKEHPWYNKIVCCDWDTFCTKCLDMFSIECLGLWELVCELDYPCSDKTYCKKFTLGEFQHE